MNRIFLLVILILLTIPTYAKKVKVLFLGNSYTQTNNIPEIIKQLAASTNDTLIYSSNTPGGYTFENHSTNPTSLSLIQAGDWDYVVLQEQSQKPAFPDDFVASEVYPYAKTLDSLIHVYNPCATTVFYMTWGRKDGDADNCAFFPLICTYEGMDSLLQSRYTIMAETNEAALAPVAKVWRKIRTDYSSIELYNADKSHPNNNGSYASACTFYTIFFQKDPTLATYSYTVSTTNAEIIRNVAKIEVYDHLETWFQFVNNSIIANFNFSVSEKVATFTNISENATSYHWNFGDGSESTENSPTHEYSLAGTYIVTLTAKNEECENVFDIYSETIVIESTTSIEENVKTIHFDIYPNPVQNKIFIQTLDNIEQISVLDITGECVYVPVMEKVMFNTYLIDIEHLPNGVYFIQLTADSRLPLVKKIIKN